MELETGIPPPSLPWQMEKQGLRAWPRVTESHAPVSPLEPHRGRALPGTVPSIQLTLNNCSSHE